MIAKFGTALFLLLASVLPSAAAPFHHPFGEWREYNRDWLAACPDAIDEDATEYYGFSCFASTGSQEQNASNLPAYKLTVFRNRLTGDLDVAFVVAGEDGEADTTRPLVLTFGGEPPMSFDFTTDLETRYNTVNQFFVVDADRKQALLDKMKGRNSVVVTVPVTGATGTKEVWLSMRGLTASIDFMTTYARKVAQY
ncbi:hypothetical protein [Devosia sp. SL43]|uniref:hypothetical protein n=1 Tax=Devosia sp. SL43 TaxID=2806348 RepID=UPI001F4460EF|nr:hypothetical protein [Devosia sp. SL43]UJW85279.1 hypothetical protein IM737_18050 [Devosia sp. SL43]